MAKNSRLSLASASDEKWKNPDKKIAEESRGEVPQMCSTVFSLVSFVSKERIDGLVP